MDKVCVLPVDPGKKCDDGSGQDEMFYFDSKKEKCTSFNYLGCEGNGNRFRGSDDCIDSCQTPWFIKKNKEQEKKSQETETRVKSDCQLSPISGDCKAMITMWYFNTTQGKCDGFGYGGKEGYAYHFNFNNIFRNIKSTRERENLSTEIQTQIP